MPVGDANVICERYRCIFIHQRKCAGTSIIRSFGYTPDDDAWHGFNEGCLSPEWKAMPPHVRRDYLVFTVARNPWDRFVSGWKYLEQYRNRDLDEVLGDLPAEGHGYRHLTRPQLTILMDDDRQFVPDVVLRYETLDEDFRDLCATLGMPYRLERLNRSRRSRYTRYFNERQARRVGELFKVDTDYFGYEFGH